ncbi:MAG: DinB family protein [Gemmatimonadaceae bacterium]|nr:DinB family protein [Gemmatimonadaceae bacterium]MCW5827244.1 DinB family protein [Gemmatimonadaceae bacterium]
MAPRDRLGDALRRAHDGSPWHGPSRSDVLADLTPAEAAYRAGDGVHTIWEIVLHMRSWTEEVLARAQGGVPSEPVNGDWPPMPAKADDAAWHTLLRSLDAAHAAMLAQVTAMDEAARAARVKDRPGDPPGSAITQRAMIRSLAEHDVYHTGQVALLKRIARQALAASPTPPSR